MTWAIGDIHGDYEAFERLLDKLLPRLEPTETLVLLGDYVDRGPDSRAVLDRIRELQKRLGPRLVALRGNHEDAWLQSYESPNPVFLLHPNNGCIATWRSLVGREGGNLVETLTPDEMGTLLNVSAWFPTELVEWMQALPVYFEDEHAIYVHAGLDHDARGWLHPEDGREEPLFWTRSRQFFSAYEGKPVVFGHTRTELLLTLGVGSLQPGTEIWRRGTLVALDTGSGMGGHLSAVQLPTFEVLTSGVSS